ncbi:MAG: ABC transporter substrate-binding protein [Gammaproteobacteria bacterium]
MADWDRRTFCIAACAAGAVKHTWADDTGTDFLRELVDVARRSRAPEDGPLRLLLPAGSEANVQPVIDQFSAQTGVQFRVDRVAVDDINTKLLLAAGSGESIDVALPATYGIPDLVEAGALTSFDDINLGFDLGTETESLFTLGDYYNNQRYGLQTDGDVYVMFYNARLLNDPELAAEYQRQFGEPAQPAQTWGALDRLIRFYHAPSHSRYGGALFRTPGYLAWEFWIRLHAKGRLPFDDQMRPQLTSDEGVVALEELTEVTRYLHPAASTAGLVANWELFAKGETFCCIGWGGSQKYFMSTMPNDKLDVVVAPTPGGVIAGQPRAFSYFNWGWNYAVPSTSSQPELAALFAYYAASPQMSTQAVREQAGFFDPFHESHYSDTKIAAVYGEEFLSVHRQSMRDAIPDLYLRGRNQYFEVLDEYLRRVDRREITPANALSVVSRLWEVVTDELGRAGQVKQWRLLKKRYPGNWFV